LAAVFFALLFMPEEAVGQAAWLGSEELHRVLGGSLESMLDDLVQFLQTVLLLACGLIYGATRLFERGFERSGRSPMPVASTSIAFVLFSVSFWAFFAVMGDPDVEWLVVGSVLGLLPATLVLMIELIRLWRLKKRDAVPVDRTEGAVASD
jgi:Na+-driven multidrug efflux pump